MSGYQSFWDKISVLISANLNSMVNRALSMNSLAVFDEYLNRMRAELAALQSAEGFERGRTKTLTRQIAALDSECARYDHDVDRLLLKGERNLAAARQTTLNTKRSLADQLKQSLTDAQAEVERLTSTRYALGAQIERTETKRSELRSLLEQRKAAMLRAKAMAGVTGGGDSAGLADGIVERVRQETEIAQGRAEAGAITLDSRIYEIIGAEDVEIQLQEREERLHPVAE